MTATLRYHPGHRTGAMRSSSSEGEVVYVEGDNEPLDEVSEENDDTDDQDPDPGMTPETLRQRFGGEVDITDW